MCRKFRGVSDNQKNICGKNYTYLAYLSTRVKGQGNRVFVFQGSDPVQQSYRMDYFVRDLDKYSRMTYKIFEGYVCRNSNTYYYSDMEGCKLLQIHPCQFIFFITFVIAKISTMYFPSNLYEQAIPSYSQKSSAPSLFFHYLIRLQISADRLEVGWLRSIHPCVAIISNLMVGVM